MAFTCGYLSFEDRRKCIAIIENYGNLKFLDARFRIQKNHTYEWQALQGHVHNQAEIGIVNDPSVSVKPTMNPSVFTKTPRANQNTWQIFSNKLPNSSMILPTQRKSANTLLTLIFYGTPPSSFTLTGRAEQGLGSGDYSFQG